MWDRFAPRLRRTIFLAADEADRSGSDEVGPQHLLLALCRDAESAAAIILRDLGIPPERVRHELALTPGQAIDSLVASGKTRLAPASMSAIELALAESTSLGHDHVGTEHILLALARGRGSNASDLLSRLGLRYDDARASLRRWLRSGMPRSTPLVGRAPKWLPASVGAAVDLCSRPLNGLARVVTAGREILLHQSLAHPGFRTDPYPLYRRLRASAPVRRDALAGAYVVTRYEDVAKILRGGDFLRDPFSSDRLPPPLREQLDRAGGVQWGRGGCGELVSRQMLFADPPQLARLRTPFVKGLGVQAIRAMRPRIQEIADLHLDKIKQAGQTELMEDFAIPLPLLVVADLLGFPLQDAGLLKRWSDDFAALLGIDPKPQQLARSAQSVDELRRHVDALVSALRRRPRACLLSTLMGAESENTPQLTREELLANVVLVLAAGHETTTNLIGNGVLALLRNPNQLANLRADPSLISSAVQELLRFDSPVQWTSRVVAADVTLAGVHLERGQYVFASLGSANRDDRRFADPDRLDIRRRDNPHLAFGHGAHYCVGAALAVMEAEIAIGSLVTRFPHLRLASGPGTRLRWRQGLIFRGLQALPILV